MSRWKSRSPFFRELDRRCAGPSRPPLPPATCTVCGEPVGRSGRKSAPALCGAHYHRIRKEALRRITKTAAARALAMADELERMGFLSVASKLRIEAGRRSW